MSCSIDRRYFQVFSVDMGGGVYITLFPGFLVNILISCCCRVTCYRNLFLLCRWSWSSSCGRQSVDRFVRVSGLPLGPLTRFYLALLSSSDNYLIILSKASSLTRGLVCSLQCNHSLVPITTISSETAFPFCRLLRLAGTTVEVF
jgi:hypothetical protein